LEFSVKLNPLYFNFHVIMEYSKSFPKFDEILQAMNRSAIRSAREIFRRADELELNATLENEPKPYYGLPSQFKEFSKISGVNFCLDVGHVARIQESESNEDCSWDNWFRIVGNRLLLVHLNDCVKEGSEIKDHRVLGAGYLDFMDLGKRVKKTDAEYCTLECFEGKSGETSPEELRQSLELAEKCF
jgi:sugar phosphate isomerase/epimerase